MIGEEDRQDLPADVLGGEGHEDGQADQPVGAHAADEDLPGGLHYELAVEEPAGRRLAVAFDGLAMAI